MGKAKTPSFVRGIISTLLSLLVRLRPLDLRSMRIQFNFLFFAFHCWVALLFTYYHLCNLGYWYKHFLYRHFPCCNQYSLKIHLQVNQSKESINSQQFLELNELNVVWLLELNVVWLLVDGGDCFYSGHKMMGSHKLSQCHFYTSKALPTEIL